MRKTCGLKVKRERNEPLKCYALKSKDSAVRLKSSSGGAFSLLAKSDIAQGGVVYGCLLDKNINAIYGRAQSWDECIPFMGSKYVQSDMGMVVKSLMNDLMNGRTVLFTGTPCECLGIKTAVSNIKHTGKLVLCDFYCHGVTSTIRSFLTGTGYRL